MKKIITVFCVPPLLFDMFKLWRDMESDLFISKEDIANTDDSM